MSEYILYGEKMVKNDNTLKDFAESIVENIPTDDFKEIELDERSDIILERVTDILDNDISRTDINYENLMYKYRNEIGDLLYEIQNNGYDLGDYPICFFGKRTQFSFNSLIYAYIRIHLI